MCLTILHKICWKIVSVSLKASSFLYICVAKFITDKNVELNVEVQFVKVFYNYVGKYNT